MGYNRKQRLKFAIAIKNRLMLIGCEFKTQIKNKYIILIHIDEEIYIPLCPLPWNIIYYIKEGNIIDTYESEQTDKFYNQMDSFLRWHKKRNLKRILQNDNETKAYI